MHRLPSLEWERSHSDLPAFDHHRLTFSGFMRASPHPIFQTPTQRRPSSKLRAGAMLLYTILPFERILYNYRDSFLVVTGVFPEPLGTLLMNINIHRFFLRSFRAPLFCFFSHFLTC